MGVAKGVMGVVPKEHTEKFLACFKKTRTNKEEIKETKAVHKFKIEK